MLFKPSQRADRAICRAGRDEEDWPVVRSEWPVVRWASWPIGRRSGQIDRRRNVQLDRQKMKPNREARRAKECGCCWPVKWGCGDCCTAG